MPETAKVVAMPRNNLPPLTEWPPPGDAARMNGYSKYRAIWKGNHEAVLPKSMLEDYELYIACNLGRTITQRVTELIWNEEPRREYPDNVDKEAQARVEAIWQRSELDMLGQEASNDIGKCGDGVFVISAKVDEGTKKREAYIDTAKPDHWAPVIHPDNRRKVLGHRLGWAKEVVIDEAGKPKKLQVLRLIEHSKGLIENKIFELKGTKLGAERPYGDAVWMAMYGESRDSWPAESVLTGVDDFLVVHVPNFRTADSFFGDSDYAGGVSDLYAALNTRLTQIDKILGHHSDPMLAIPDTMLGHLREKYGDEVDWKELFADLKIVSAGSDPAGDSDALKEPKYITWDGQLEANFKMIESLVDLILVLSKVDRQLVGKGEFGTMSGRALNVLFRGTLATAKCKWMYQRYAIEKCLELAQKLEQAEPVDVNLIHGSWLPSDPLEEVEVARNKVDAGFSSRKREGMRLNQADEEEWQKIDGEISEDSNLATDPGLTRATERTNPIGVKIEQGALV